MDSARMAGAYLGIFWFEQLTVARDLDNFIWVPNQSKLSRLSPSTICIFTTPGLSIETPAIRIIYLLSLGDSS